MAAKHNFKNYSQIFNYKKEKKKKKMQPNMALLVSKSSTDSNRPLNRTSNIEK